MLENLTELVKQYAGDAIINNPSIPNEKNDEAIAGASGSIFDGLKNAVSSGNLSSLTGLFNGSTGDVANSAVGQNIQSGFVEKLMQKFGLDQAKAGGIASSLIPIVLEKFVKKTNDPNDKSFDIKDIISAVTGGGGGIMGSLKGMFN